MTKSIWQRRHEIERARQQQLQLLMEEYDKTVYHPQKGQLIKDCLLEGHSGGKFHDNGFGWTWQWCGKCGGKYNISGPSGEWLER